jgi:hypothetical protein
MAQPSFSPVTIKDKVGHYHPLENPERMSFSRPAELRGQNPSPIPALSGNPGPDQGYALKLANELINQLNIKTEQNVADVKYALVIFALKRASLFGRAPVKKDLECGAFLLGYLSEDLEPDFIKKRSELIKGLAHNYEYQRRFASLLTEEILLLPSESYKDLPKTTENFLLSSSKEGV